MTKWPNVVVDLLKLSIERPRYRKSLFEKNHDGVSALDIVPTVIATNNLMSTDVKALVDKLKIMELERPFK
jgi:3-oxoacyl-ACP reductase-like protein